MIIRPYNLCKWSFGRSTLSNTLFSGAAGDFAFISTWDTTNTSAGSSTSTQIQLPLLSAGTYNFVVDWGDGNSDTITAWDQTETLHTYSSGGTYQIKITGQIEGIQFMGGGDRLKILDISRWGPFVWGNGFAFVFSGCGNLDISAGDVPSLSTTTSLASAFLDSGVSGNLNNWNISNVTSLGAALRNTGFDSPLDRWDTSSVTDMGGTFRDNGALTTLDISGWDVTALTAASFMFAGSSLTTALYDALLIGWEAQSVNDSVTFHAGTSQYTSPGPAADARAALISDHSWSITDGGIA